MKTPINSKTHNSGRSSQLKLLATVVALVSAAAVSRADHFYTNNATGDYNVAGFWDPNGVPGDNTHNNNGSANVVLIQPGDPVWNHGDTLAGDANGTSGAYLQTGSTNNIGGPNWLRMGCNSGAFGSYILSNGVVNVGGRTQIGESGTGYLEIDGGIYNGNVNDGNANPAMVCGQGDFGPGTGTLVINGGTVNMPRETWIGQSVGTGSFFMNGGTYNANDWFAIARAGAPGVLNMTNGTINKTGNGEFLIGTGGTGFMNQTGGVLNSTSRLRIGDGSTGVYNLAGGSASVGSEFWIGQSGTGNGTLNLSGTAALTNSSWLAVGREGAHGVLNISGGTMVVNTSDGGANISICHGSGASGTVNQSGGTFKCVIGQTWIGEDSGTGTWNMTNGLSIHNDVHVAQNSSASGLLNLVGGTFQANSISSPSPTATTAIQFNGGTLQARANNVSFLSGLAYAVIDSGNAIIDSQSYNITIPQTLTDDNVILSQTGGLTKEGTGMLTLTGANTYTGNTTISGGSLFTTTASSTPGSVTLADNTGFGVTVMSAGGQYSANNLTLGSSVGSTLNFDMGSFGNPSLSHAPINVSGTLANHGVAIVNVADGVPQVGQFPLIKFGSMAPVSGSFVVGSLPTGVQATIVTNIGNSSIDLNIGSVNQPRWDGQAGATWDTGLDTNWVNIGTGLPTHYTDPSIVLFDDEALGSTTVNLTTTVHPLGITVTNNTLSYSIVGAGKISGSFGINKQGTSSLAMLNTGGNDFTGPVTISGGTLSVTNLSNDGVAGPIGKGSLVVAGGNFSYAGPAASFNRSYTTTAGGSTITTVSNLTLTGVANATASGGLVKTGLGQLTYATAGSNTLSGTGSPGYQVQAGAVVFDGSIGGQSNYVGGNLSAAGVTSASIVMTNTTVNTTGNMDLGIIPGTVGNLTLNNGATLNVGSWFTFSDAAGSSGTCTMNSGSTLNVNSGRLFLCSNQGTYDTFNINGGVINKSGDYFAVVNGGWNGTGARTGVVNQVSGTVNCLSELWVGDGGGAGNLSLGIYNLSGGTVSLNSWFGIGRDGSTGIFNMTNGILNKTSGGDMVIGRGGSHGTFHMTGGTVTKDSNGALIVGQGQGVGELDQSGGTITTTGEYWLGVDNGTIATNNISGTAEMDVHNWVTIGRGGLGVVNMSGGQFNSDVNQFVVGIFGGSQGIWNQSNGALTVNQEIWIGQGDNNAYGTINLSGGTITNTSWLAIGREGAHGTLNITGGTMVKTGGGNISIAHNGGASGDVIIGGTGTFICASGETWVGENAAPGTWTMNGGTAILGTVHLAQNADATGVMTLNGGSLTATEISTGNNGAAQRELDFNGGTLVAGADNSNFIHDLSAANVKSGGAIINTASHSVSVNQAMLGGSPDGGLTKNGNGTLQLNAVNTYTNVTTVSAGTLGGAGTIAGPVKVAAGATLSPGTASIGTLAINNTLTLSNLSKTFVKVSLDGGVNNDAVVGLTGVAYNGSLTVNNVGTNVLTVGSVFQLFNVPGSISGNFSSVAILPFGHGTFNPATGQLTITSMVPPTVNKPVLSGGNLILSGTGGTPGGGYTWLTSTNVTTPIGLWTVAASGVYDSLGAFSNAIPVSVTTPTEFFRFRTP